MGSGTLKDTFLFCTFSILTPNEAEEETGLSPDLHHQLWQIQCIYCSCIANSEDLVFEDAWIHSQFSVMLPWIFLQAEEHHSGGGQICAVSGHLGKGTGWLKAVLLSTVKGFLQWRFHTCTVLANERMCCWQLISGCCSVHWVFAVSLYSPPRLYETSKGCSSPRNPVTLTTLYQSSFFQDFTIQMDQLSAFRFGRGKDTRTE